MTINDALWILCGVALAAMALISVLFGSGARTRSLDDVYARRDQRLGQGTSSGAASGAASGRAAGTTVGGRADRPLPA